MLFFAEKYIHTYTHTHIYIYIRYIYIYTLYIYIYIKTLSKDIPMSLISTDGIGWMWKKTIRLNDDIIWVQPIMENVNELGYSK